MDQITPSIYNPPESQQSITELIFVKSSKNSSPPLPHFCLQFLSSNSFPLPPIPLYYCPTSCIPTSTHSSLCSSPPPLLAYTLFLQSALATSQRLAVRLPVAPWASLPPPVPTRRPMLIFNAATSQELSGLPTAPDGAYPTPRTHLYPRRTLPTITPPFAQSSAIHADVSKGGEAYRIVICLVSSVHQIHLQIIHCSHKSKFQFSRLVCVICQKKQKNHFTLDKNFVIFLSRTNIMTKFDRFEQLCFYFVTKFRTK